MIQTKAQAAVEYLMTYGWALLIILVAIAALSYFGVFSPGKLLPPQCYITPSIQCNDFRAAKGATQTLDLVLQNGAGASLNGFVVQMSTNDYGCTGSSTNTTFYDGQQQTFTITLGGCTINTGQQFKSSLTITYALASTGLGHVSTGLVVGKVE